MKRRLDFGNRHLENSGKSIIAAAFGRQESTKELDLTVGFSRTSFLVAKQSLGFWPSKRYVQHMYCGTFMLYPIDMF